MKLLSNEANPLILMLNTGRKSFFIVHTGITLLISSIVLLFHFIENSYSGIWMNIGAVLWASLITAVGFLISYRSLNGSPGQFSNGVMASMMMKMLLSLVFIGLVLYLTSVSKKAFIASYFTAFFLLGAFEVYTLLNNLKPKSNTQEELPKI